MQPNASICPEDTIVFAGDSITDCGRDRAVADSLGSGYVQLIAGRLLSSPQSAGVRIFNRGIGGNRITDLEARLVGDVIALKPTVVSILIGINDTWRHYDSGLPSPIAQFRASYVRIIQRLKDETGARIVICEPFLLPVPADRAQWREDLDPRITAIREVAWEFQLPYLALDGIFATAATTAPLDYWLPDGVHPSLAGHGLIASHWLSL